MSVRNGSGHDTEYEVQQPMPFTGSTVGQTVLSIALIIGGVLVGLYSVSVDAGTTLNATSLLLVIAGVAVQFYTLLSGTGNSSGATESDLYVYAKLGKVSLKAGDEHPSVTFAANSMVYFYGPKGGPLQAKTEQPVVTANAEVALLEDEMLAPGGNPFRVEITP